MDANVNQKVSCIANFSYEASAADELSLRVGDVVRDVEQLSGGWWRGELRGRRGMFPDNFVTVIDQASAKSGGVQGRCRAVFSYQPANGDELPLCVGDVLDVLGEVEEGWWQGRRQGRVGVFPSNFVVMLDPTPAAAPEPAPALPPKPVKELCRVLYPYAAVNEDELTLTEGDIVTVLSKDAPDRGWWRGELNGKMGLFPDNFVQLLPPVTHEVEEKRPERPPAKSPAPLYPVLNKYSEKITSVKELTTSKVSLHKENTLSKESTTASTVTHTSKSDTEKIVNSEPGTDSNDGQIKKPPVPTKKSPTPGVGSIFSGLKNKMLSSDKADKADKADKEKPPPPTSAPPGGGETDKPDGVAVSRPNSNTFDHVERNSILNDPRAGRVKAPRRRPPSQALRDDTPQLIGLSNGHEVPIEKPPPATEEIKPRAREWDKHQAPWLSELKLNQAKKTSDHKPRTTSQGSDSGVSSKAGSGSTDRLLDVGVEEKRSSHSMEMSKSTSSISSRISVLESFEETTRLRHSLDSKKESGPAPPRESEPATKTVHSPTAAGRTFHSMLDEVKKPPAPSPPAAAVRDLQSESTNHRTERNSHEVIHQSESEKVTEERHNGERTGGTIERVLKGFRSQERNDTDNLIAQLNNRITNLEKLLEARDEKFNAAIKELNVKLTAESEKRVALETELRHLTGTGARV